MHLIDALARGHLQAALDRTPLAADEKPTLAEVESMVRTGDMRLWMAENATAVTEIVPEISIRAALAGGDLGQLLEMCRQAELLGRHFGLDQMVIDDARPGWSRVLQADGFRQTTRLVKEFG